MISKDSVSSTSSGGVGFFGLLAIVFITLKLLGYINWSWFWVLSPIWGSCLLSIIMVVVILVITFVIYR